MSNFSNGSGAFGSGNYSFSLGDPSGYLAPKKGAFGNSEFNFDGGVKNPEFGSNAGWKPKSTEGMELMEDGGAYTPTTEFGGKKQEEGIDWDALAKVLGSIATPTPERAPSVSRAGGGGSRFDASQYDNPLVAREFQQLYSAPLYNKLV
ncbi:MAG: hypothetical protein ACRC6V_00575 [Bacteroidales bacterium]